MFATCTQFAVDGAAAPLDAVHLTLMQHQTTRLNADGFRVIAVAYKDIAEPQSNYRNEDESDLTLLGYIAFLDPPKVREWISSALASPDLVLEAQPPAQPHSRVVVEHPIRFAGGSNPKAPIRGAPGSTDPPALWSPAKYPLGRSARGLFEKRVM